MGFGAQRQALAQLAQLRLLQALFEFRLPDQNDLQEFFGEGLQIGEHADFFEHFVGEVLGLVDDQHRSEEHTSELQSLTNLVCRLLLEKKKTTYAKSRN